MVDPIPEPCPRSGVYRYFALIDGRPAFYTVDWNGVESPLRIVMEDEREEQVIEELAKALGLAMHGHGASRGRSDRPPLFLV